MAAPPQQEVVDGVVRACDGKASRPAAAFVVRMMAYRREAAGGSLPPPPPPSADAAAAATGSAVPEEVAQVAAYLASEHPSAVTVRMQAAFEAAYSEAQLALERRRRARARRLGELGGAICGVADVGTTDIGALAGVYKQVLAYVTTYLSADPAAAGLRPGAVSGGGTSTGGGGAASLEAAQRELAAAMESVFPRVGVKAFTGLPAEDKRAQLDELAHLVLGIRLFNWSAAKGGTGIEDTPAAAAAAAAAALRDADRALAAANEAAQAYVDTLVAVRAGAIALPPGAGGSWAAELGNRRQLAVYVASLADELRGHEAALAEVREGFGSDMAGLKDLVGGRAAVSKATVYPRFHALAVKWLRAVDLRDAIGAVVEAFAALAPYVPPTVCSLPPDLTRAARARIAAGTVGAPPVAPPPAAARAAEASFADDPDDRPQRLSLEHSPEFLQLPLDYQGYCPVTLCTPPLPSDDAGAGAADEGATALGLLVAGDPALAVVRWRGKHVVCANADALAAFCAAPAYYVKRIHLLALRHIELVHLLQLLGAADGFAAASIPALVQYDGDMAAAAAAVALAGGEAGAGGAAAGAGATTGSGGGEVRLSKNGRVLVDKGVETPVHFVERNIDRKYQWNEWVLRRQALAIMNLRKCKTTSAQTDASHFRRDADTQVYLPKPAGTQTGISVSTNTTRVMTYVSGLRGAPEPAVEAAAARDGIPHTFTPAPADAPGGAGAGAIVAAGGGVAVHTSVPAVPRDHRGIAVATVTLTMDV